MPYLKVDGWPQTERAQMRAFGEKSDKLALPSEKQFRLSHTLYFVFISIILFVFLFIL